MADQVAFENEVTFAENPEPRLPCVLLLDTSGSMAGSAITELAAGVAQYRDEVAADTLASKRVEVAVVSFGGQVNTQDFDTCDRFVPPTLTAGGDTPMGAAIVQACDILHARKELYRRNGIVFYRPWIFLITDGAPTDSWQEAARRVKEGEHSKAFSFFAVAVHDARLDILSQIAVRDPIKLDGIRFRDLFKWLSNSQQSVSRSKPGTEVALPSPSGWSAV